MTVHTIMLPDMMRGREPRSVIWDDEAGTVAGEHWDVPWMQGILAEPKPIMVRGISLRDPGHDPADFLVLLWCAFWLVLHEPLRSTLPSVFDGVAATPPPPLPAALLDANGELKFGIMR